MSYKQNNDGLYPFLTASNFKQTCLRTTNLGGLNEFVAPVVGTFSASGGKLVVQCSLSAVMSGASTSGNVMVVLKRSVSPFNLLTTDVNATGGPNSIKYYFNQSDVRQTLPTLQFTVAAGYPAGTYQVLLAVSNFSSFLLDANDTVTVTIQEFPA